MQYILVHWTSRHSAFSYHWHVRHDTFAILDYSFELMNAMHLLGAGAEYLGLMHKTAHAASPSQRQ